jgi:hypothetical protein
MNERELERSLHKELFERTGGLEMKRMKIGFLVAAVCMSFWAVSALADSGTNVKADIPFAFYVGDQMFPAGNYVFSTDDPEGPNLLTIESQKGERHQFVLTKLSTEPKDQVIDHTELVFNRYGSEHFLSEVQVQGDDEVRVLPQSNLERSQNQMDRERVTVRTQTVG